MKEIDHEYTDEITCPYCGYEEMNSTDFIEYSQEGENNCYDCGKKYKWLADFSVDYTTSKI